VYFLSKLLLNQKCDRYTATTDVSCGLMLDIYGLVNNLFYLIDIVNISFSLFLFLEKWRIVILFPSLNFKTSFLIGKDYELTGS
jgi:hypothetical protein